MWLNTIKYAENTMLNMDLRSIPKVWYQFLKHFLMPISNNETVRKAMSVLLNCLIACTLTNIVEIICQEIHACAKNMDRVLLISRPNYCIMQKTWNS